MFKNGYIHITEKSLILANRIKLKLYLLFHPFLWGKGVQLNGMPKIYYPSDLEIGKDVSINDNVVLQCGGGLHIGNCVTISNGASILTAGLKTDNYLEVSQQKYRNHISAPVIIGDGVWICANVIVTPGVEIAPNCIIAAGSVVSKSLTKPLSLYGGVPAVFIKDLS